MTLREHATKAVDYSIRVALVSVARHFRPPLSMCMLACGTPFVTLLALHSDTASDNPLCEVHPYHLTNRWSQPLAVVKSTFDFVKLFSMFATLAPASGGSAPSR